MGISGSLSDTGHAPYQVVEDEKKAIQVFMPSCLQKSWLITMPLQLSKVNYSSGVGLACTFGGCWTCYLTALCECVTNISKEIWNREQHRAHHGVTINIILTIITVCMLIYCLLRYLRAAVIDQTIGNLGLCLDVTRLEWWNNFPVMIRSAACSRLLRMTRKREKCGRILCWLLASILQRFTKVQETHFSSNVVWVC